MRVFSVLRALRRLLGHPLYTDTKGALLCMFNCLYNLEQTKLRSELRALWLLFGHPLRTYSRCYYYRECLIVCITRKTMEVVTCIFRQSVGATETPFVYRY
jgi:hypothetical protein